MSLKRKFDSLDDQEQQAQEKEQKAREFKRSISLWGHTVQLDHPLCDQLIRHCEYFRNLFVGPFAESKDKNADHIVTLNFKSDVHMDLCASDIIYILRLFALDPYTLFRSLKPDYPYFGWTIDQWLVAASLARYMCAESHLQYIRSQMLQYVEQRKLIYGTRLNQIIPYFKQHNCDEQLHRLMHLVLSLHDRTDLDETFLIELYRSPVSVYDFLIDPFNHHNTVVKQDKNNNSSTSRIIQTDRLTESTCWSTSWTSRTDFWFLLDDYCFNMFELSLAPQLPRFVIAGGFVSMLLQSKLDVYQDEYLHSDVDLWFLNNGDIQKASTLFVAFVQEQSSLYQITVDQKHDFMVQVTVLQPNEQCTRTFQFLSVGCFNPITLILGFDFTHLQWFVEPIFRRLSEQDDHPTLDHFTVLGTQSAFVSLTSRLTQVTVPYVQQLRVAKALKRGFDVWLPDSTLLVCKPGQVNPNEYGPTDKADDFIQLLHTNRQVKRQNSQANQPANKNNSEEDKGLSTVSTQCRPYDRYYHIADPSLESEYDSLLFMHSKHNGNKTHQIRPTSAPLFDFRSFDSQYVGTMYPDEVCWLTEGETVCECYKTMHLDREFRIEFPPMEYATINSTDTELILSLPIDAINKPVYKAFLRFTDLMQQVVQECKCLDCGAQRTSPLTGSSMYRICENTFHLPIVNHQCDKIQQVLMPLEQLLYNNSTLVSVIVQFTGIEDNKWTIDIISINSC